MENIKKNKIEYRDTWLDMMKLNARSTLAMLRVNNIRCWRILFNLTSIVVSSKPMQHSFRIVPICT